MRVHSDRRADRYCDIVPALPGDLNVFILKPGQVSAWHRHFDQTDHFFVVPGGIVVIGTCEGPEDNPTFHHVYETGQRPFVVAPGTWHGYKNIGRQSATVVMYLSQKYNPQDEYRLPTDFWGPWPESDPWIGAGLVDDEWNKGQDPDPDNTA